jgi:hypothetical protein
MEYENMLKKLSIKDLKSLIKTYMKEIKITITGKKKKELVEHILKHTEFKNNKITLKSKTFDLPEKQQDDKIKKPTGINRKIFNFVNDVVIKDKEDMFITDEFIDKKDPSNNRNIYKIRSDDLISAEEDIIINIKNVLLKNKLIEFKYGNTEYSVGLRKNSVIRINVKNFIFPEEFIKEFEEEQDDRLYADSPKTPEDSDDERESPVEQLLDLKPNFTILVDIPFKRDDTDSD